MIFCSHFLHIFRCNVFVSCTEFRRKELELKIAVLGHIIEQVCFYFRKSESVIKRQHENVTCRHVFSLDESATTEKSLEWLIRLKRVCARTNIKRLEGGGRTKRTKSGEVQKEKKEEQLEQETNHSLQILSKKNKISKKAIETEEPSRAMS